MKPLTDSEIKGNWATLLLPVNPDDSIDYKRLETEIDTLIGYGVNGIYSNGTAGEFYNIDEREFDEISGLLADKCNSAGMPFQIGVSHMSPVISLNRLKRIVHLKPSAVQVILPDWFAVTDEEAIAFLRKMEENSGGTGLVLYNPPHAKRLLQPEDFQSIRKSVPGLVGIKVAGGDDAWYARMRECCAGISVFIPGHHLASGINRGASGSYSNMACLNPLAAQKWYELALIDQELALDLEKRINTFLNEFILPLITKERYSNQAVDKLLAAIGGWSDIGTRLRWPYRWIGSEKAKALKLVAKGMIPEFFDH